MIHTVPSSYEQWRWRWWWRVEGGRDGRRAW
jgi:hypothetical protein